jgi:outer membrane receptor for ferrienterochelin and colicins
MIRINITAKHKQSVALPITSFIHANPMHHTFRRTMPLALILAPSLPAIAQEAETELSEVVVTASGFEQKITDAPASISVVSNEELAKRPYVTLLDAVRDLEGVDIGETRDKTGQGTISIRGMGADYTLVLVDGRRQNNHGDIYPNNFGGNQFNHIPPLDAVERIEVIRGPASTLHGADAMGGVINIITRRSPSQWHGSTSVSRSFESKQAYGDDTTLNFFANGPLVEDRLSLAVRASIYDRQASNPVYDEVVDPAGGVHSRTLGFGGGGKTVDNRNKTGGASLAWTPGDSQRLTLDVDFSRQKYDNGIKVNDDGELEYPVGTVDNLDSIWSAGNFCLGASGNNATACGNNGGTWSRRANPRVGYGPVQEFSRDSWSLTHEGRWSFGSSFVSLAHVATNNEGRTMPFTVAERLHLLQVIDGTGAYAGLPLEERRAIAEATFLPRPKRKLESAQYTLDARMDLPFESAGSHTAVLGAQVIRGELTDGIFGIESGTPGATQDHNMVSLFAEDTWKVFTPLAVTAGLRLDDHEVFGSQLSPRLYGVYTVNNNWTVKGGVSTGFKTPKTTQLYDGITGFGAQGTSPQFGNPDLKPETSTSTELAVYWQRPGGDSLNITLFNNRFDDKIDSQPCGPATTLPCASAGEYADLGYGSSTRATNIDKVVIRGVEVAGRWRMTDRLSLRANYTYTDSEQKSGVDAGLPLGNTAKHLANATLDWRASGRLNLFVTSEARSKRFRDVDPVTSARRDYKSYAVLHTGASWEASSWLTINARVNNLLDRDFTTYDTFFIDLDGDGLYQTDGEVSYLDHFNNKDKARSYWLSLNVRF